MTTQHTSSDVVNHDSFDSRYSGAAHERKGQNNKSNNNNNNNVTKTTIMETPDSAAHGSSRRKEKEKEKEAKKKARKEQRKREKIAEAKKAQSQQQQQAVMESEEEPRRPLPTTRSLDPSKFATEDVSVLGLEDPVDLIRALPKEEPSRSAPPAGTSPSLRSSNHKKQNQTTDNSNGADKPSKGHKQQQQHQHQHNNNSNNNHHHHHNRHHRHSHHGATPASTTSHQFINEATAQVSRGVRRSRSTEDHYTDLMNLASVVEEPSRGKSIMLTDDDNNNNNNNNNHPNDASKPHPTRGVRRYRSEDITPVFQPPTQLSQSLNSKKDKDNNNNNALQPLSLRQQVSTGDIPQKTKLAPPAKSAMRQQQPQPPVQKGIIEPTQEQKDLMRQISALGLEDPVFGHIHESTKPKHHPSNIFEDMDIAAVPEDMKDILSVHSDKTDPVDYQPQQPIPSKISLSVPSSPMPSTDRPPKSFTNRSSKILPPVHPNEFQTGNTSSDLRAQQFVPPSGSFVRRQSSKSAGIAANSPASSPIDHHHKQQLQLQQQMNKRPPSPSIMVPNIMSGPAVPPRNLPRPTPSSGSKSSRTVRSKSSSSNDSGQGMHLSMRSFMPSGSSFLRKKSSKQVADTEPKRDANALLHDLAVAAQSDDIDDVIDIESRKPTSNRTISSLGGSSAKSSRSSKVLADIQDTVYVPPTPPPAIETPPNVRIHADSPAAMEKDPRVMPSMDGVFNSNHGLNIPTTTSSKSKKSSRNDTGAAGNSGSNHSQGKRNKNNNNNNNNSNDNTAATAKSRQGQMQELQKIGTSIRSWEGDNTDLLDTVTASLSSPHSFASKHHQRTQHHLLNQSSSTLSTSASKKSSSSSGKKPRSRSNSSDRDEGWIVAPPTTTTTTPQVTG